MFARLLALFVLVPAIELYLLIQLGTLIGALETFAVIFLTGLLGTYLAKSQGFSVWRRLQAKLASGSLPGQELLDAVIILVSGALLITPGILTDIVGFLGLFPVSRGAIIIALKRRFSGRISSGGIHFGTYSNTNRNNGFYDSRDHSGEQAPHEAPEIKIGGHAKNRPSGKTPPEN